MTALPHTPLKPGTIRLTAEFYDGLQAELVITEAALDSSAMVGGFLVAVLQKAREDHPPA
jgi:hypothetical protein